MIREAIQLMDKDLESSIASQAAELVGQMTLGQKAALTSGENFWYLKGIEELGLASIMVTDGPHGLRKQLASADNLGISDSVPATCFPTASATACSFDRELMRELGVALGEECRSEDVAVILGPGINIKRSPLCGRNFEYISEDPFLAGELACAYTQGVQSQGVGVSLKHFAGNNQETRRMTTTSAIDERALREIYLSAFERVVKQAQPWTVMCSYNRLFADFIGDEGIQYASDNHALLTGILRDEWGFEGLVVSDWGGLNDRVAGIHAGLDLEMPGVSHINDQRVEAAVGEGRLAQEELDRSAQRVVELILKAQERKSFAYDKDAHHALARKMAARSAVLLKNEDGILPANTGQHAAVIGAFVKEPRYQGTGSSKINPNKLECAHDELAAAGLDFEYAAGYRLGDDAPDETLIAEACAIARDKDIVYIFAGLPDACESEGFDRTDLHMPAGQVALIERVWMVNRNIVVVLAAGGAVEVTWEECAKAILMGYLGGEAGAGGIVDVLFGTVNPSGKLAESWPLACTDNPSYAYFPGYSRSVEYRESIFVGYRYYDSAQQAVLYPFGFGLSYTQFKYSNLVLSQASFSEGDNLEVCVDISNVGERAGAEVVQLYVSSKAACSGHGVFCAEQELKGFERIELEPGETKTVRFMLDERAFSFFNTAIHDWCLVTGEHGIRIGSSSRNIRLAEKVAVISTRPSIMPDYSALGTCYTDFSQGMAVGNVQFEALYGRTLPAREMQPGELHTQNSTLAEIEDKWLGRRIVSVVKKQLPKFVGDSEDMRVMAEHMFTEAPLRMVLMAGGDKFNANRLDGLVTMLNGHFFAGLLKLIKG